MKFRDFNGLYVFVQIAHYMSFKEAARHLHLTPGAISHRIRKVEEELGVTLFIRDTRKIALTPEGKNLYQLVSLHFSTVSHEIENINSTTLHGTLEVGCTPTFAQHWLVPKLTDFHRQWPDLGVHMRSKGSRVDFNLQPVDLWIDYGNGHYPGLQVTHLLDEVLMPVCSPEYAQKWGLHDCSHNLRKCLLLHNVESIEPSELWQEWATWLTQAGDDIGRYHHHYSFTHYDAAIIAARSGLGVAMGRFQLVQPLVEKGELIFPFDAVCDQGLGYYAVIRSGGEVLRKVQVFCQWLQSHTNIHR